MEIPDHPPKIVTRNTSTGANANKLDEGGQGSFAEQLRKSTEKGNAERAAQEPEAPAEEEVLPPPPLVHGDETPRYELLRSLQGNAWPPSEAVMRLVESQANACEQKITVPKLTELRDDKEDKDEGGAARPDTGTTNSRPAEASADLATASAGDTATLDKGNSELGSKAHSHCPKCRHPLGREDNARRECPKCRAPLDNRS